MYAENHQQLQPEGIDADSFEALAAKALENTAEMSDLTMVCGPITTGGTGNQIYNFQIMNTAIRGLQAEGTVVFDQLPYEVGLRKLLHQWEAAGNSGYCMPILEDFYSRVFKSGRITRGLFVPGWESSYGACWERDWFVGAGHEVRTLTRAEIRRFLETAFPREHVAIVMSNVPSR